MQSALQARRKIAATRHRALRPPLHHHHQPAPRRELARGDRQSNLRRRHPRPPRPQRPTAKPIRRQPPANPREAAAEKLTAQHDRCHRLPASEAPRPGRHHVGIPGAIISECLGGFIGIGSGRRGSATALNYGAVSSGKASAVAFGSSANGRRVVAKRKTRTAL
jgi:hypothetical protein